MFDSFVIDAGVEDRNCEMSLEIFYYKHRLVFNDSFLCDSKILNILVHTTINRVDKLFSKMKYSIKHVDYIIS